MTKIFKYLLVILVLASMPYAVAQAGGKRSKPLPIRLHALEQPVVSYQQKKRAIRLRQRLRRQRQQGRRAGRRIAPSAAFRAATRAIPGSKGLGIRFVPRRQVYVVVVKTRGRVQRVFVDAITGIVVFRR